MSATFWDSELGEVTGTASDAFAKTFIHIPDGTMALAKIESFVNSEFQGNKFLSIDWLLTDGEFKGRKVNQKLKVFGDINSKDPSKARHRALNMLKLMYQLFGIKLSHAGAPTDKDLLSFIGMLGGIVIKETEPNHAGKQYNWVSEVHSPKGFKCETGIKLLITRKPEVNAELFNTAFSRNPTSSPVDADILW